MKDVQQLIESGKHFCVLPWIHFHSWPDKRVLPCCVADSNQPYAEIKEDESILEMMNSEKFKEMRKSFLNDEPVSACQRCYDLEALGTHTMRMSHNMNCITNRNGVTADYIKEVTDEAGALKEFKLKYMDMRFSNLCNMKCRSCGPSCSSLWAQEFIEHKGVDVLDKHFKMTKMVVSNNDDQKFMTKLKPYLKDVVEVYFAGGEIIITPEHYECLDYWIETGVNETIELTYTTNFSSLKYKDKDLIEYWKKFPKLIIWASLDGMGSHAELIRKGTDWDRIEKNLRELKELVPHAQFQITPTISIWNVFQFPKFFDYLIDNGLIDKNTVPRFNLATSPWYANIMILPEFSKEKLSRLYREYIHKYSYNKEISNGFKMVSQNLKSGEPNKGGIQEFIKFNDELDMLRNEKILDVMPELKEVYRWAKS
jgi:hypothetical protein